MWNQSVVPGEKLTVRLGMGQHVETLRKAPEAKHIITYK